MEKSFNVEKEVGSNRHTKVKEICVTYKRRS